MDPTRAATEEKEIFAGDYSHVPSVEIDVTGDAQQPLFPSRFLPFRAAQGRQWGLVRMPLDPRPGPARRCRDELGIPHWDLSALSEFLGCDSCISSVMTAKDLQTQFDYGYWANAKLFEVVSRISTEQFTQPIAGSYGSIRNTLVHMMSTEWGWLERSGGHKRGPKLIADDFPTFASVLEAWGEVESNLRGSLDTLQDDDLDRRVEFTIGDRPKQTLSVGQMMHHAAIHGVHHRGQVALLLRSLGEVPGNFDMFFYYRQLPTS